MKRILVFLFFIFLSFSLTSQANASILYSDQVSGIVGLPWTPNGWVINSGPAIYSNDGALGLFDYYKDFLQKDIIVKFDLNVHSADTNIVFACRATSNYSDVEQGQLTGNSTPNTIAISNATECISGICEGTGTPNPYSWPQTVGTHHVEMACIGSTFTLKYDGNILTSGIISSNVSGTGVRLYADGGTNSYSNIQICDSSGCSDPTPTPTPVQLNVPLLKQTDSPWQAQEYDTAHIWAPNNPTIHDWGCALTSAAMVLNFHGITKMPDNSQLDPGSLNSWLKSQPDGYLGSGLVNWYAIPRLTKLAKLSFNNPSFTHDALLYKRMKNPTNTKVLDDLQQNRPDILEEPNHFVVAKGVTDSTISINDPYFARATLNDGYNNTFSSAGQYIPTNTDLSYIVLVGNDHMNFSLQDATGSAVGEQFTQSPLQNDSFPNIFSGNPVHVFALDEPLDGSYNLTVNTTNNSNYSYMGYLYDINGDVKKFEINGTTGNAGNDNAMIIFEKQPSDNSSLERIVTFQTLLDDINRLYQQHEITNSAKGGLLELAKNAQKDKERHLAFLAQIHLNLFLLILDLKDGHGVSPVAHTILSEDAKYLKNHL